MIRVLIAARAVVSLMIVTLAGVSFVPREAANRLIPLQKVLTNMIVARRAGARK